jgi:hypothetical protein
MAGLPPPGPPKLGYKSKRQLEEEERARAEAELRRQEEERLLREQEEAALRKQAEAAAAKVAEERRVWGATQGPPAAAPATAAPAATVPGAPAAPPQQPGAAEATPPSAAPAAAPVAMRPSAMTILPTLSTAHELRYAPPPELLAPPAAVEEEAPAQLAARPRRPPRPPRSPDMRPVWAGFLLVGAGLTELLWGLVAMARAPGAGGEGAWADVVEWAAFSAGFSAAVLGAFAVRGGLWSFRKERYDRVKWGAVCATICVWALWVPWVVGFAALLIVHAARDEYYPNYDPARDAPEWARPPRRADEAGVDAGTGGATTDGEGEARSSGQPSPSSQP